MVCGCRSSLYNIYPECFYTTLNYTDTDTVRVIFCNCESHSCVSDEEPDPGSVAYGGPWLKTICRECFPQHLVDDKITFTQWTRYCIVDEYLSPEQDAKVCTYIDLLQKHAFDIGMEYIDALVDAESESGASASAQNLMDTYMRKLTT